MDIGIIGAGNIGATLTRRLTALGHRVRVANSRGPHTLSQLASETGATAVTTGETIRGAELLIITIPQKNVPNLPGDLFRDAESNLVVVDTGNYYPQRRDGVIPAIEEGLAESVWVAQCIGRPVIKAFNNIAADHLQRSGKPKGAAQRVALPVAGDDARAKSLVMQIVDELGFDPVDAGSLSDSWRQQPGTPVYGTDLDAYGLGRGLSEAKNERKGEFVAAR